MGIVSLKSNLAINGTPDRYDTKGVLGNVDDPGGTRVNFSQLDIDKNPERYNTAGKLGTLDAKASSLDFDSPLPAQVDNFINTNANGFTIKNPVGVTQFINDGQTSLLGRPTIPEKYDITGKLGFLPAGASNLDFDSPLPPGSDVFENDNAKGFTIKNPVGISQFVGISGNTYTNPNGLEIINTPGIGVDYFTNSNAQGFTIKNPIGVTQFINDGQTSLYGFSGVLPAAVNNILDINANGFTIRNPIGVSQFINGGQTSAYGFPGTLPPAVDNILNTYANGFTIKNPIGVSQFVGINGNTFTNPNGTVINTSPGPGIDFMPNTYAKGFTIKNPVGVTQFVGVNGTTFTNPNGIDINTTPGQGVDFFISKAAKGFTIKNPYGESQFIGINGNVYNNPTGNRLGVVNYFPDPTSGATGFKTKVAPYESGFIGISADSKKYQYPDTVYGARLLNVSLGSSGGTAKLENQLGGGSPKISNKGFYAENRYSIAVRNDSNQSLLASWALREHSPSPLDTAYTYSSYYGHDLKLRSTAYNPTYMMHPLILRGLQNPDHLGPQRWGLTAGPKGQKAAGGFAAALDGGFIRGGASTALERSIIDTARIAKFMASPKGIVWAVTQVGLGKSNVRPYGYLSAGRVAALTANPAIAINNTHTHLGITSLLSVPGSAFGLHFTRHGIPFLNEAADYSNFHRGLKKEELDNGNSLNRLALLKEDLLNSPVLEANKTEIVKLSTVGGPQSVYGIGNTTIRRVVDTSLKNQLGTATDDIKKEFFGKFKIVRGGSLITNDNLTSGIDLVNGKYSFTTRYAPEFNRNRTKQGTIADDKTKSKDSSYTAAHFNDTSEKGGLGLSALLYEVSKNEDGWTPGEGRIPGSDTKTSLNDIKASGVVDSSGNEWSTLTYLDIQTAARERTPGSTIVNDFRKPLLVKDEDKSAASNLIPLDKKLENTVKSYEDNGASWTPGNRGATADNSGASKNVTSYRDDNTDAPRINTVKPAGKNSFSGNTWNVLPYQELRNIAADRDTQSSTINDFRAKLKNTDSKFITDPKVANFDQTNLRDYYGFGDQGKPDADRTDPYQKTNKAGDTVGNIDDTVSSLKTGANVLTKAHALAKDPNFRGDRVNAIDYISKTKADDIYPEGAQDFIKFYFSGIKLFDDTEGDAIVFRASIKGLADSFSPGWSSIQVMGRPDGPALYSSFERNISFNFTAAATSREELVPMWRKLNYLGSYTMPIYGGGKPGGALCRMTIGDMFNNVPGYFTGLTISVNDEATWDLANDTIVLDNSKLKKYNKSAKQLPNLVDVDVQFKILHDWRPQKGGRVYYLYNGNYTDQASLQTDARSWLWDSNI